VARLHSSDETYQESTPAAIWTLNGRKSQVSPCVQRSIHPFSFQGRQGGREAFDFVKAVYGRLHKA
jgi:hypothetical protein